MFDELKVCVKMKPLLCTPESQGVQPVQGGPGMQLLALHVPEVVE